MTLLTKLPGMRLSTFPCNIQRAQHLIKTSHLHPRVSVTHIRSLSFMTQSKLTQRPCRKGVNTQVRNHSTSLPVTCLEINTLRELTIFYNFLHSKKKDTFLESLMFPGFALNDALLAKIVLTFPNLKFLDISVDLEHFISLYNPRYTISNPDFFALKEDITPEGLKSLGHLKKLQELWLIERNELTDAHLKVLLDFTHIQTIALSWEDDEASKAFDRLIEQRGIQEHCPASVKEMANGFKIWEKPYYVL